MSEISTKANEAIRAYESAVDKLVEVAQRETQAEHRLALAVAEEKAARANLEQARWATKAARGEVTRLEHAKSTAVCMRDHSEPCARCKRSVGDCECTGGPLTLDYKENQER